MKKEKFILIFLFLLFWGFDFTFSRTIKEDVEMIIKESCQKPTKNSSNYFSIEPEIFFLGKINIAKYRKKIEKKIGQSFFREYVFVWKILDSMNKTNCRYAIVDHVIGKVRPITFLLILESTGAIVKAAVVRYREDYGGAVQNNYWLRQFLGKSFASKFAFKTDIDNISGATISVKSLTKGIHKIVILFPLLQEELEKVH